MKQSTVPLHVDAAVSAIWEGTPVRHSENGVSQLRPALYAGRRWEAIMEKSAPQQGTSSKGERVKILGTSAQWPTICACCCGAAETTRAVGAVVSVVGRTRTTLSWQTPYCRKCIRHMSIDRLTCLVGILLLGGGVLLFFGAISVGLVTHSWVWSLVCAVLVVCGVKFGVRALDNIGYKRRLRLTTPQCCAAGTDLVAARLKSQYRTLESTFIFYNPIFAERFRTANKNMISQ
jgi:hypothetical protein